mgnify:CR=1 FL=1
MPLAILGVPLYIYLPTYYATNINLSLSSVGILLFIARLTDVISDPFFGYISDYSQKTFDSKKPIMIIGLIILILSFYLLINPNKEYASFYLFLCSILVYGGWSMINIPYLSWSAEITTNYYEKSKLNASRELFTILGLITALLIPYFLNSSENLEKTLNILFITFILLIIPFFTISLFFIKPKIIKKSENYSFKDIKNLYKTIPKLKNLHLAYFLNNTANAFPATLFLLYIATVIKEESFSGLVLISYFIAGVLALPIWIILSKKIAKIDIWKYSIILASCAFIFIPFLNENDLVLFIIISIISGLSLGADITFPSSIHSDIVQKNSNEHTGLLFGIWSMISKISLAFSIAFSFIILDFVDFDKTNSSQIAIFTIMILYGVMPIILKVFSLFIIKNYKE